MFFTDDTTHRFYKALPVTVLVTFLASVFMMSGGCGERGTAADSANSNGQLSPFEVALWDWCPTPVPSPELDTNAMWLQGHHFRSAWDAPWECVSLNRLVESGIAPDLFPERRTGFHGPL